MLFIDWQPSAEIFSVGTFVLRWYSVLWGVGITLAFLIVRKLYELQNISEEKFYPQIVYCIVGVLIGARLGHCLFYQPEYYLTSGKGVTEMILPFQQMMDGTWKYTGYRGLASHGGTIGLFIALILYWREMNLKPFVVLDNIAIAVPVTACCIRLGNLVNSEIIGKTTDVAWAFVFHTSESLVNGRLVARHPAQLYEAIAYLAIFIASVWIYWRWYNSQRMSKTSPIAVGSGFYFGFCLTTIFTFRFFVEFLKKEQVDFESEMPLDMGQLLSIPFVLIGLWCIFRARKCTSGKGEIV